LSSLPFLQEIPDCDLRHVSYLFATFSFTPLFEIDTVSDIEGAANGDQPRGSSADGLLIKDTFFLAKVEWTVGGIDVFT